MPRPALAVLGSLAVATAAWGVLRWRNYDAGPAQVRRIAAAMNWRPGETVAELGAGDGRMSVYAAERVGPSGRVYSVEIDAALLKGILSRAASQGLENVVAVESSETSSGLPENCCEAVFMRWVYHHLTRPREMNASLFRSVRPNGLLLIADFPVDPLDRLAAFLKGRKLDGVKPEVVARQVTAAGFSLVGEVDAWPGRGYGLLFSKPPPPPGRPVPSGWSSP